MLDPRKQRFKVLSHFSKRSRCQGCVNRSGGFQFAGKKDNLIGPLHAGAAAAEVGHHGAGEGGRERALAERGRDDAAVEDREHVGRGEGRRILEGAHEGQKQHEAVEVLERKKPSLCRKRMLTL